MGQEKWASVKYERLSDFCYGCERLGYTSLFCHDEVVMSELRQGIPSYGSWIVGNRPSTNSKSYQVGGEIKQYTATRDARRKSWRDVMNGRKERERWVSSNNEREGNNYQQNQIHPHSRTTKHVHREECHSHTNSVRSEHIQLLKPVDDLTRAAFQLGTTLVHTLFDHPKITNPQLHFTQPLFCYPSCLTFKSILNP